MKGDTFQYVELLFYGMYSVQGSNVADAYALPDK